MYTLKLWRWLMLASLLTLLLAPAAGQAQDSGEEETVAEVRSVVILVHGVTAGEYVYDPFIANAFMNWWPDELAQTEVIELDWGPEPFYLASTSIGYEESADFSAITRDGISRSAWWGAEKLVETIQAVQTILGQAVPITIISQSQGTLLTLAALQDGAVVVENWVLLGSPLNRVVVRDALNNTRLLDAATSVEGQVANFYSPADTVVAPLGGIGALGLPEETVAGAENILNIEVDDVPHTGPAGWWQGDWGQAETLLLDLMLGPEDGQPLGITRQQLRALGKLQVRAAAVPDYYD